MRHPSKVVATLLCAVLLMGMLCPTALAAEENGTVYIETPQDLIALAASCSLDSWSRGKTVILKKDVDLTGIKFSPIPTFGGVFDGQGHTISGLTLTSSGNTQGLFRYLQEGSVVKDLQVTGRVCPQDFKDTVGGVVGDNSGSLLRCSFQGTIQGDLYVGGIAGINQAGGEIINCSFSGNVSGQQAVGGVAGQNLGSVIQCTNQGRINTTKSEREAEDLTQEPSLSDAAADLTGWSDVGGIAGSSSGILQSCQNSGAVGYPHVGYNIGGIAGRQSGFLDGCVNTGRILGRKDVGGVVGQLEPEMTLLYSESLLARLGGELDTLQTLTDRLLKDADGTADDLSAQIRSLSDQTRWTQQTAQDLGQAVTDWADQGIQEINHLSVRISQALDDLEPILGDLEKQMGDLTSLAKALAKALTKAEELGKFDDAIKGEFQQALSSWEKTAAQLSPALTEALSAAKELRQALGDEAATQEAAVRLRQALENLVQGLSQGAKESLSHLENAVESIRQAAENTSGALSDLLHTGEDLSRLLSGLTHTTEELHELVEDLSHQPGLAFPSLNTAVSQQSDAFQTALSGLMDEADALGALMDTSADTLLADLKAINSQIGAIADVLRDEGTKAQNPEVQERFEDVSDQQDLHSQTTGRVSACQNQGTVEGDMDVAGIIGAMSIDLEFDPEDDLTREGERSFNVFLQAKAVAFDCVNTGIITGKKDYSGGIVGRMDLGHVESCENYGDISATDGSYVGGIAGASWGSLSHCWSRCILSGTHHIGGIAGLSYHMSDCRSAVEVDAGSAYVGAVAGEVDPEAAVSGNLFAQSSLAGIDGISYAGAAEPTDFAQLCALPDVPAAFTQVELTFVADGQMIAKYTVPYGEGLSSLPDIPSKEGCSASWPELDYEHITASRIVEALYSPYISSLSDGKNPPQILVSGSFSENAEIRTVSSEAAWNEPNGTPHSGTSWSVEVVDPQGEVTDCTIHFRLPDESGGYALWVLEENGWEMREATVDGSYLVFSGDGESTTFCVLTGTHPPLWLFLLIPLVMVLAAGGILLSKKRRAVKIPQ